MRVKTQITFPRNRHTKRTMPENLYLYQITRRALYLLFFYLLTDFLYLSNAEFSAHHHCICKKCIEFNRFYIGNIYLRGNMHLHTYLPCIGDYSLIHRNYSRKVCCFGFIQKSFDDGKVVVVDNCIKRKISSHSFFLTSSADFREVI